MSEGVPFPPKLGREKHPEVPGADLDKEERADRKKLIKEYRGLWERFKKYMSHSPELQKEAEQRGFGTVEEMWDADIDRWREVSKILGEDVDRIDAELRKRQEREEWVRRAYP